MKPVLLQLNGSKIVSLPFLSSLDEPLKPQFNPGVTIENVSVEVPITSKLLRLPLLSVLVSVQMPAITSPASGSSGVTGAVSPGSSPSSGSDRGGSSSLAWSGGYNGGGGLRLGTVVSGFASTQVSKSSPTAVMMRRVPNTSLNLM